MKLNRNSVDSVENKKVFFCNYLKFRYILNILINDVIFNGNHVAIYCIGYSGIICSLFNLSRSINKFLPKMKWGFSVFILDYDISRMKNENGIPVIKSAGCDDLYRAMEALEVIENNVECSLFNYLGGRFAHVKKDIELYLKQQIAFCISKDLLMVNIAHWLAINEESPLVGEKPVLMLEKRTYWNFLVLEHLKSKGLDYRLFRSYNLKDNSGAVFLYHFFKLLYDLLQSMLLRQNAPCSPEGIKIGVPFYVFQNFTNFFDIRNYYLFWFPGSNIAPKDITIYVPDAEFKIDDDELQKIKDAGFHIVFCPTRISRKKQEGVTIYFCSQRAVVLLFNCLGDIWKLFGNVKGKFMREQWKILSSLLVQLPYWEDFFSNNHIGVKLRFHDIFGHRDIAAKLSGAVTLSYHYSNHSEARLTREEICDVFFVWGCAYQKILSARYSTTATMVIVGYIFDYTFNNLREKATEMKNRFKMAGVSYTIGIFDENITHLNYFTKSIISFYRHLFEYASLFPDIGLLIKPKKELTIEYLRTFPETAGRLQKLESQHRVMILDNKKYPVEAGYASDLVIGVIPDSTAGLECALAGIPMIIFDCTRRSDSHPLYKTGYKRVIFDDAAHLVESIELNRKTHGFIPGFADWSGFFPQIDPFRDGMAGHRVAVYIEDLLAELSSGGGRERAITAANESFAKKFGKDKITKPN